MALAPGLKLGAYEIVVPLGADGMGEVYRARDAKLGRATGKKHTILPVPQGYAIGKSIGVTRDDRWITYTETAAEGDVWLASWE